MGWLRQDCVALMEQRLQPLPWPSLLSKYNYNSDWTPLLAGLSPAGKVPEG
jgi:hypothetical protein